MIEENTNSLGKENEDGTNTILGSGIPGETNLNVEGTATMQTAKVDGDGDIETNIAVIKYDGEGEKPVGSIIVESDDVTFGDIAVETMEYLNKNPEDLEGEIVGKNGDSIPIMDSEAGKERQNRIDQEIFEQEAKELAEQAEAAKKAAEEQAVAEQATKERAEQERENAFKDSLGHVYAGEVISSELITIHREESATFAEAFWKEAVYTQEEQGQDSENINKWIEQIGIIKNSYPDLYETQFNVEYNDKIITTSLKKEYENFQEQLIKKVLTP